MKFYLLTSFLAILHIGSGHIVLKNNCNYKDNDLANEYASSPYECGTKCANTPRCTHFTWVPEAWTGSSHCWMKHAETEAEMLASHETARDPKAFCGHLDFLFENGAVSRDKSNISHFNQKCTIVRVYTLRGEDPAEFEILRNCDYKDNDLFNEVQDYVEGCASRCYENPSCTHFTWDLVTWRSRPICYLKHSASKDDALATRVAKLNGAMCGFVRDGKFGVATTVAAQPLVESGPAENLTELTPPESESTTGAEISPSDANDTTVAL